MAHASTMAKLDIAIWAGDPAVDPGISKCETTTVEAAT